MDFFSKYSIGFFKIEKTPNRSSLVKKINFIFHQLLWVGQINPKLSPSRLFSACKKKSDQGLSPLSFFLSCHTGTIKLWSLRQPFILPLVIHVSIFTQIIHPLYPGADPGCLDRGLKFTGGGGGRFFNFIRSFINVSWFFWKANPQPPLNPTLIPVWFADFLTLHGRSLK